MYIVSLFPEVELSLLVQQRMFMASLLIVPSQFVAPLNFFFSESQDPSSKYFILSVTAVPELPSRTPSSHHYET